MSTETLMRSSEDNRELDALEARAIGETVFSALAVDAESAMEKPTEDSDKDNYDFTNSVTRLGDGQTVPDER